MILISQAYVLSKIWAIKTNNKSYLRSLSRSWTFHLFIKNNFKIFLQKQGLWNNLPQLSKFERKNWIQWIKNFDRYNLSPEIWHGIAPNKWRFKVGEHWKKNKVFIQVEQNKKLDFLGTVYHYSFLSYLKSSLKGVKKRNKLLKKKNLTCNFFDQKKNAIINNFFYLDEKSQYNHILISKIQKYLFNFDRTRIFMDIPIDKKKIFFEYNLLLWFVPEFIERTNKYKHAKILDLNKSIIRYKHLEIFQKKELLREREVNQSIRQWRWKSRNYEKRFKELGNMASLMTFMQNQETMVSLSGKVRKDLDLFHLFLRRNTNSNQLAIDSEHRLPRLLDDQNLIYKLITPSLDFKQRLKKLLNLQNIDEYFINKDVFIVLSKLFDLEDLLLPRRRRALRIFNSLAMKREIKLEMTGSIAKRKKRKQKIRMDKNKIIKRFIWSSYRFEDLACMNRFWFGTINGSRFSMLRFRMYPII